MDRARRRAIFDRIRKGVVAVALGHADKKQIYGPVTGPPKSYFTILGTGFYYDPQGLVLTAGHVHDKAHEALVAADLARKERPDILCVVYLPGRRDEEGSWVTRFQTRYVLNSYRPYPGDVAVLNLGHPGPEIPIFPITLASEPCQLGDEVVACGFPRGLELHDNATVNPSFAAGIIASILPDHETDLESRARLQLDAVAHGGSSGGPVCDLNTGHVVGLVVEAAVKSEKLYTARDQVIDIPLGIAFAEDVTWIRQVIVGAERAFATKVHGLIHQEGPP